MIRADRPVYWKAALQAEAAVARSRPSVGCVGGHVSVVLDIGLQKQERANKME
jgi:hypothetical protein